MLHSDLTITGEEVEQVTNYKFRGLHISEDLNWAVYIMKKVQQLFFFPEDAVEEQTLSSPA